MTDSFQFGENNVVGVAKDGVTRPVGVTEDSRFMSEQRTSKQFAATDAFDLPKTTNERLIKDFNYTESVIQINFNSTIVSLGNVTFPTSQGVLISSGAAASSSVIIQTKQIVRQPTLQGLISRWPIRFGTVGIAGNSRSFGLNDGSNGWCIRLDGTVLKLIQLKGGVPTETLASAWDVPVVADLNIHLWTVQTKAVTTGDFDIFLDQQLVHTIRNLGTSATEFSDKSNLPVRFENINDTALTDETMFVVSTTVSAEGVAGVVVNDGQTDISINSARRLNTQAGFSYLMSQDMDQALDTIKLWDVSTVGAGAFAQPANTFALQLSVGTGATDEVFIISRLSNLRQGVGEFAVFEAGLKYDSVNPTNHIKEWGYLDSSLLNGVYWRLNGGIFEFVTLKGGVEAVTNINQAKPNSNFHNFRIEQLGSGKITGIIINEAGKIVDFSPAAQSLVGSGEKKPFFKVYNTAVLGVTPDIMEVHWTRLIDMSGASIAVRGRDSDNVFRDARVTQAGNLAVSIEATPSSDVNIVEDSVQSGTVEKADLVGNGDTWVIKGMSGGTETSNSGAVVSLFIDPLGTGVEANYQLITRAYVNGATTSVPLSSQVTGDGTLEVVLQRRQFGGGSFLTSGTYAADIL